MSEGQGNTRRRMAVFYAKDAEALGPEMMPTEGMDESALSAIARVREAGVSLEEGAQNLVLFREPGEEGMSLVYLWFKSGYVLPFHSHNVDCLYYVLGGELHMGSHVLRKGDGMFIPEGQAYGYQAGPEGVEVLEFRNATHFNLRMQPNAERRWERIAETYCERAAAWASESAPPSERR